MSQLPDQFVRTQFELHGAAGREWLARIPNLLDQCARQWALTVGPPFGRLSYHYVAPAVRADGYPVVVKLCSPTGEFELEAAALRRFDGHGCARLLAADRQREALLLERLQPGRLLRELEDDDERTTIGARIMRHLWRPAPDPCPFPTVNDWARGLGRLRARYDSGTGPLPAKLVEEAEALFAALDSSTGARLLLHGDLHHDNILDTGSRGWLAIDPKGVVGDPVYETATFLRNCLPLPLPSDESVALLTRRVVLFARLLGFDPARIRAWGFAHAVLSAWWSLEDHGHGWEESIAVAEMLREVRA